MAKKPGPSKPPESGRESRRAFVAALLRSRAELVPPAFACLFQAFRYLLLYGGRGGAKSWSIARALLVQALDKPLRILVCREIMGSLQASAWQLLKDQIELLGLDDHYSVLSDRIIARNGTEIFFEGLFSNSQKLKSYESIDVVWIEEAQSVSEQSWEVLRPTMRKPGSRIIVSWNPLTRHDAVMRFVTNPMPRSIIKKVGWEDNPHLSAEAHEERLWMQKVDPDLYRHVWGGEPREVSDSLILKNKYQVEPFEPRPEWSGPHYGLDLGFGPDPCAATECWIDDEAGTLYVKREFWGLHVDIDALQQQLEMALPGISGAIVHADSSRPETISYLQRHGIPGVRPCEKWAGSVDDGILYLRHFSRIVLDPGCKHTLDECQTYSFRLDPKTNLPIPKPVDRNNHLIDSLRYGLGPLIRNEPRGFIKGDALLATTAAGEIAPVSIPRAVESVFAVAAITEAEPDALATVYFAAVRGSPPVVILDWDIRLLEASTLDSYFTAVAERLKELCELTGNRASFSPLIVEPVGLGEMLLEQGRLRRFNVMPLEDEEILAKLPVARVVEIGGYLTSGAIKLSHAAFERFSTFKGARRNHLTAELAAFTLGADKPKVAALTLCFATGALHILSRNFRLNVWRACAGETTLAAGPLSSVLDFAPGAPTRLAENPPLVLCGVPPPIPPGVKPIDPAKLERIKQQIRSMRT